MLLCVADRLLFEHMLEPICEVPLDQFILAEAILVDDWDDGDARVRRGAELQNHPRRLDSLVVQKHDHAARL